MVKSLACLIVVVALNTSVLADDSQEHIQGLPMLHELEKLKGRERADAIYFLAKSQSHIDDRKAVCDELRSILVAQLKNPSDPDKLEMAADLLGQFKDPTAVSILIQNLTLKRQEKPNAAGFSFGNGMQPFDDGNYPLAYDLIAMGDMVISPLIDACLVNKDIQFQSMATEIIENIPQDNLRVIVDAVKDEAPGSGKTQFVGKLLKDDFYRNVLKKLRNIQVYDSDTKRKAKAKELGALIQP